MLLFGKQFTNGNANKIGGVIILFELFKEELESNKIEYEVVDLNWRNYSNPVFAYIYIIWMIIFKVRNHSVISFHGTANEFIYLSPLVVFWANYLKKKVSLKKFAGNFDRVYQRLGFIRKSLVGYSLRNSSVNFFETSYLVSYFSEFNSQTFWFPNVRRSGGKVRQGGYSKKFVFVGQVKATKGVFNILDAFKLIDESYTVDFYGPLEDERFLAKCLALPNCKYKGVLAPAMVEETIANYDVLLLPTFHLGEGYPGVILEAFSCSVPVIASNWGGIPEIVEDSINGFIIPPKDVDSLKVSILKINDKNFDALSLGATNSFGKFDSNKVTLKALKLMGALGV